jgi:hypothetical protein
MPDIKPTSPHAPRDVVRRPIDYFLVLLSAGGMVLYWPIFNWLQSLPRELSSDDTIWLAPFALMCLGATAGVLWTFRGGATRRGRLVWAILVMFGLLGWAPSCVCSALTYRGPVLVP